MNEHRIYTNEDDGIAVSEIRGAMIDDHMYYGISDTLTEVIIWIEHGYRLDGIVIETFNGNAFVPMRVDELAFEADKETKNKFLITFTMPDDDITVRIHSTKIPVKNVKPNEFGILPRLKGSGTVTVFDLEMTDGDCYISIPKITVTVLIKPEVGYQVKNGSFRIVTKSEKSIYTTHTTMYKHARDNVNCISFDFYMPSEDVVIYVEFEPETTRDLEDKFNMSEEKKYPDGVVDYFEIPEDLAKELSELLTKQVVRERLLMQVVSDPVRYEEIEKMIIPITSKVEAIKLKITNQYVPGKYRSSKYMWNYDGWEVDKNKVQILEQN